MRNLYAYIIIIIWPFCAFAQTTPYYKNYTVKNGLPTNELYWIHQAKDGQIFIGSDAGLVGYDGVNFETYSHPNARNKSINGIVEDSLGIIWCHNFANQLFYFKQEKLHLVEVWDTTKRAGSISKIQPITNNRLYLTNQNNQAFIYHIAPDSLEEIAVLGKGGNIESFWMSEAVQYNVFFRRNANTTLNVFDKREIKKQLICEVCTQATQKNHRIYYAINNSPIGPLLSVRTYTNFDPHLDHHFFFRIEKDTIVPIPLPQSIQQRTKQRLQIINTTWQNESIIWLATSNGIFSWNIRTQESKHYFSGIFTTDIIIDREKNIWVTTLKEGLLFIPSTGITQHPLLSATNNTIQCIESDQANTILIGHSNHLLTHLETKNLKQTLIPHTKNVINSIIYDPIDNIYWINRSEGNTTIFNPDNQSLKLKELDVSLGSIKAMAFDSFSNVLAASGQGAFINSKIINPQIFPNLPHFDKNDTITVSERTAYINNFKKRSFYYYDPTRTHKFILAPFGKRSYSIALEQQPVYRIWVGFAEGLSFIEKDTSGQLQTADGKVIIASDLLVNEEGVLWVATSQKGIYGIKNQEIITQITTKNGLPTNQTTKIEEKNGYLWIGTQKGLVRYDISTKKAIHWNKITGLPLRRIYDIACVSDRIYFTDGEQLLSTPPDLNSDEGIPPLIQIESFKSDSKSFDISGKIPIDIYDRNNLEIKFRGISMRSQGNFTYEYRLQEISPLWISNTSQNPIVRYPNLPSGKYTFEVKMTDALGISSPISQLEFIVHPPFYETWWFTAICMIIIALILYGIVQRQLRKIQQQNQIRQQQAQLELEHSQLERDLRIAQLKALKSQMNPHFIFNVLNSVQGLYIINDKKKANTLLNHFARLIRSILEMSEDLEVSIEEEITLLELYLGVEQQRSQNGFEYHVHVDSELYEEDIFIPSLLVQPYVENAIKHGLLHQTGEKKLSLRFEWQEDKELLTIIIEDNGIGREASQAQRAANHRSFSTSANARRLELLNVGRDQPIQLKFIDKKDKTGKAQGTTVILSIPID